MEENDLKKAYPEFKYFKDAFTQLNMATEIVLLGEDGKMRAIFNTESDFYRFEGKFSGNTEFIRWLQGKAIKININDLKPIAKCLKKNVSSYSYDDDYFTFKYLDAESGESENLILTDASDSELMKEKISEYDSIKSRYADFMKADIPNDRLNKEIFEVFVDDSGNVNFESGDKLLEMPTYNIDVIQKKNPEAKYSIEYSEKNDIGQRAVDIISESDNLSLRQLFITI